MSYDLPADALSLWAVARETLHNLATVTTGVRPRFSTSGPFIALAASHAGWVGLGRTAVVTCSLASLLDP